MDTSDKWFTLDNHGGPTEIFPFLHTYSMISAMIMARFPGSLMTLGQVSPANRARDRHRRLRVGLLRLVFYQVVVLEAT
jgi:hypothetical protein